MFNYAAKFPAKYLAILPFSLISLSEMKTLRPDTVTVSGLSSGAIMAGQMLVSSSEEITGAALIAGAPYGCAENSLSQALSCIDRPESIQLDTLIHRTEQLAAQKRIAPLKFLKTRPIFILNGQQDATVRPLAGIKSLQFYSHFTDEKNIFSNFSLEAGHGFPTVDQGIRCASTAAPWVLNCNYDTARESLTFILKRDLYIGLAKTENLYRWPVRSLLTPGSHIAPEAIVYIPTACLGAQSSLCDLHVVFHGCRQTLDEAGLDFILKSGYNDWAENNRLVILYPQMTKSTLNPKGCWDWWGYTNDDYDQTSGLQIKSIMQMIHSLTGKKK